jgi:hypothetical protein
VIRKIIASSGAVSRLAGLTLNTPGYIDATGTAAAFNAPRGIAANSAGGIVYVSDTNNCRVRAVVVSTGVVSTLAGGGVDGNASSFCGIVDGVNTRSMLDAPIGIAAAFSAGVTSLFVYGNFAVHSVTAADQATPSLPYYMSTYAGTLGVSGYSGDGGPATAALGPWPRGCASTP